MKKVWIATINVAVVAECEAAACDVISESMREVTSLDGDMIDWQYASFGGQMLTPSHNHDFDDKHKFEEGEVFQK